MNNTDRSISAAIIMAGLIVITFLVMGNVKASLRNQAVDACQKNSIVVWKDAGKEGANFVPEWFATCMQKKNYK